MICPRCSIDELAYSVLSNSLICLGSDCGWENEVSPEADRFFELAISA